jgi:N-acetylmuramic acid 6-phosphate etherase
MLKIPTLTEQNLAAYSGLDTWSDGEILEAMVASQQRAISAVNAALDDIARASTLVAERYSKGGKIYYAGAGTSIRVGVQDGSELPATYDIADDRLVYLIAGGRAGLVDTLADAEDDRTAGADAAKSTTHSDVLIAIAASGTTPYTCAATEQARKNGCAVIAVVNNRHSPLGKLADVEIVLESGPEVVAGSTRMAAGTAQKAALNLLSTLANIKLGGVHDGLMVSMRAENEKLKGRAARIVAQIANVDEDEARAALDKASAKIKPAVLLCMGAKSLALAQQLLADNNNNLRLALTKLAAQHSRPK